MHDGPASGSINRDIIGDIAKFEDWSRSVALSNCQGLDLPGHASPTKQSESLGGKFRGASLGKSVYAQRTVTFNHCSGGSVSIGYQQDRT